MAQIKISELNEQLTNNADDLYVSVDSTDNTVSKKKKHSTLVSGLLDTTTDTLDDISDGTTYVRTTPAEKAEIAVNTTHSGLTSGNPHDVSSTDIGLDNVTNNAQVKKISSNTDNNVPQWDGTTGDLLKDGFPVATSVGTPGVDTNLVTEKAVRDAISGVGGGGQLVYLSTSVASPGTGVYTITHNLGVTQADVENGRYKTIATFQAGGAGINAESFANSNDAKLYYHDRASGDPGSDQYANRQTNATKFRNSNTISNLRMAIYDLRQS